MADAARPWAAVIGISSAPVCGVRDHAGLLSAELERRALPCSWHWLQRDAGPLRGGRAEIAAWTEGLAPAIRGEGVRVVIAHYSVFDYSHRGVPLFVAPVMRVLRRTGLPVVTIVHEAVYPWNIGGARGKLWAASQRLALIDVMRSSSAVLVTAAFRADWLASRRWLARRPLAVAPVFSNLPAPSEAAAAARSARAVGLFGYAYEGTDRSLVLDAVQMVAARGRDVELRLLGAPGIDSPGGRAWLAAAEERGLAGRLLFSGTLPPQQISDALAGCAMLLFIGAGGPSTRKGSLAGSLASGTPVLALDGPRRWEELVRERALEIVSRTPEQLASAIERMLDDPVAAAELGARGRAFAADQMGVGRTADAVIELLSQAERADR